MQETWIQSLGQEDPMEKEMAIHSSVHFIISLATGTQEWKGGNVLLLESWWATRGLAGPHFLPWGCCGWEDLGHLTMVMVLLVFTHSVVPNSLQAHGLQHARLSCPSPSPRVCSNWCALSQWCHPTISFSVVPFSSFPQSFPASGSFQMSQLFISGGQVLELQLQHQSFQWTPRTDLL